MTYTLTRSPVEIADALKPRGKHPVKVRRVPSNALANGDLALGFPAKPHTPSEAKSKKSIGSMEDLSESSGEPQGARSFGGGCPSSTRAAMGIPCRIQRPAWRLKAMWAIWTPWGLSNGLTQPFPIGRAIKRCVKAKKKACRFRQGNPKHRDIETCAMSKQADNLGCLFVQQTPRLNPMLRSGSTCVRVEPG